MLVEFTVSNYRSIKDPVILSAVATKQRKIAASGKRRPGVVPDEEIAPAYPVPGRDFGLLPTLGIFGANASGKSNVLRALDDFLTLVSHDNLATGHVAFAPFLLGGAGYDAPTTFDLEVVVQGILYTYSLHVMSKRIVRERLSYIPHSAKRASLLYDRHWDETEGRTIWRNGKHFVGPYLQLEKNHKETSPFLHLFLWQVTADALQPLADWLQLRYPGIGLNSIEQDYEFVVKTLCDDRREYLARVSNFVRLFDTGVQGIEIRKESSYAVLARHESPDGGRLFSMAYESAGTKRLFTLAFQIIATLELGALLIVDELEHNLHPYVTHAIVRMFQDPKINPKRAQLVFSGHDNTLMRGHLLRRDQIWLTEKRRDQSTDLRPLSDYQLRNDDLVDLKYLNGRFGAVPILPADYDLGDLLEAGQE